MATLIVQSVGMMNKANEPNNDKDKDKETQPGDGSAEAPGGTGNEMPDPRSGFALAIAQVTPILHGLDTAATNDPAVLRKPTPCDQYDVGEVAAHLVAVIQRITAVARGLDPFSVPQEIPGLEPAGFGEGWNEAVAEQKEVWSDDRVLAQPLVLPFATLPGAVALSIYISEVVVHTWDLAKGLGLEVAWDEVLAEGALATMQFGLPAEPRGGEVPFAPVVEIASDAPAMDRLLAWLGRQP